jgi:glutamate:Na+ symporter, ESS family
MNPWTAQVSFGDVILDMAVIGVLLLIATLIRRYVPIVQRSLVPNNIVAGVLALMLGALTTGIISTDRMGFYVYHLLGLTFIAVAMSKPRASSGMSPMQTGMMFIATYLVQGILGMLVTLGLIYTIMPDLFPGFGMLMPLAFGMGPGIAYSVATNWEPAGFTDGGIAGLSIAAAGFAFAYIHGIFWMRKGIKDGLASLIQKDVPLPNELLTGLLPEENRPIAGHQTTASEAIESLTMHWSLIGMVYGLTWLLLTGVAGIMTTLGAGSELNTLWSFHFIFCSVLGIFTRRIVDHFDMGHHVDEGLMSRTGNLFVDVMITASLAGISIAVVGMYWIPILLCSLAAGIATYYFIRTVSKHVFKDWVFERTISAYAVMTGTIQSGLVLLRVLDPKYDSPVSIDLVYASGFALVFGFPLLILINAPTTFFGDILTGYIYSLFGMVAYAMVIAGGWLLLYRKDKPNQRNG